MVVHAFTIIECLIYRIYIEWYAMVRNYTTIQTYILQRTAV